MKFEIHLKLHNSQTGSFKFESSTSFEIHLKLHNSQTMDKLQMYSV